MWLPGLLLGVILAAVVRPVSVGLCLLGSGLGRNERAFVLLAGPKGAVPILLGTVRLREQPDGVHHLVVEPGSAADGRDINTLDELPESAWISVIVRNGRLVPASRTTTLHARDQVIVLAEENLADALRELFESAPSCSAAEPP